MESEAHRSPSQCSRALELFLYFFKIGFYTFGGGWSIVAQIQQEYVQKKAGSPTRTCWTSPAWAAVCRD